MGSYFNPNVTDYSKSRRYEKIFSEQVFQKFFEAIYPKSPPDHLSTLADGLSATLHDKFTVDDFSYHDDVFYFGILNYMQTTIIPHKVEVYKSGISLLSNSDITGLLSSEDMHLFLENLIVHDLSKFSADEVFGYCLYNRKIGFRKEGFEKAWHHHKMHNKHHPEYWLNPNRSGQIEPIAMPRIYILEMIADWMGAGKTYGTSLEDWLPKNIGKFKFKEPQIVADMIADATGINVMVESGLLVVVS